MRRTYAALLIGLALVLSLGTSAVGPDPQDRIEPDVDNTDRLDVVLEGSTISVGDRFRVNFMRTLRIPDDGQEYPLPPGLGRFPIRRVEDYPDTVPASWLEAGGFFIPMYQREALWLSFYGDHWHPVAAKVGVGMVDALTGEVFQSGLSDDPQNYMVIPEQPWLDGINSGEGYIRQFVAVPLGMGYTVEGQITGEERFGGIQIIVYQPKPGMFPDKPPTVIYPRRDMMTESAAPPPLGYPEMGIGAGGKMIQSIYPDRHGIDTWDQSVEGSFNIFVVNSMAYRAITGEDPPDTPIDARTYTAYGYPWFQLYDEEKGDIEASDALAGIKTVKEKDEEHGFGPQQDDDPVDVDQSQVIGILTCD